MKMLGEVIILNKRESISITGAVCSPELHATKHGERSEASGLEARDRGASKGSSFSFGP